jgi:hypothetical protein
MYGGIVQATELNKNQKFQNVPSSGTWRIVYGIDHTDMGYFIDFEPMDNEAKEQCSIAWNGQEDPEDEPNPKDEWEYNPISLDQLFTSPKLTTRDWVDILTGFGVDGLLI